jgi:peptidoglycan/LPS O-acetylase OafA/YrhL
MHDVLTHASPAPAKAAANHAAPEAADRHEYFPGVDGLRAVAVLSVVIFHIFETGMPGGLIGVDIFFVISGFVVTSSVMKRQFASFGAFLGYFYARRIVRIFPALAVSLLVAGTAYVLLVPPGEFEGMIRNTGLTAFFGASNLYLAKAAVGFTGNLSAVNPFVHTWSLGVEEQFYLVFPVLIYALSRAGRVDRPKTSHLVILAGLCLLSLAICAVLTRVIWYWGYLLIPSRFWELGLGMLAALTMHRWRAKLAAASPVWRNLLGLAAFGVIAHALFFLDGNAFPFPSAIPPVLGAAALIALCVSSPTSVVAQPLAHSWVVYVGKISYSLYLWHAPIFVIMRSTVGLETAVEIAAAVALSFAASALSYAYIEKGAARLRARSGLAPRMVILVGAGATFMAFLATAAVYLIRP